MGVWTQNIQTGHEGDFFKKRHVKQQVKSTQVYGKSSIVKWGH